MDPTTQRLMSGATETLIDAPPQVISYSNSTIAAGDTPGSGIIPRPANYEEGDLFVWIIHLNSWFGNPPGGWTYRGGLNYSASRRVRIYTRVVTGAEPATYSWSHDNIDIMAMVCLRGALPNWAYDGFAFGSQNNVSSISTPNVNTTSILSVALFAPASFSNYQTIATFVSSNNITTFDSEGVPIVTPVNHQMGIYRRYQPAAGTHSNNAFADNLSWTRSVYRKTF